MTEQQNKRANAAVTGPRPIKMPCFLNRRLEKLYTPIVDQNHKIRSDKEFQFHYINEYIKTTVWKDFSKLHQDSLNLVAKNRHLRLATKTLNAIAQTWDNEVRGSNDGRSHYFFFCPTETDQYSKPNDTIYTRMFCDYAPPDQRLICIFLPNKTAYTQLDFYETLHETGHFIGRRIRKERIELFREAIVAEFCNQVYLRTMQMALQESDIHDIPANIENNIHYDKQLRMLSYSARQSVMVLFTKLKLEDREYDSASTAMATAIDNKYFSESYRTRAKKALSNGYFSFATPVVLTALQSKLVSLSATELPLNIQAAYTKVSSELQDSLSKRETPIPEWVKTCERQYQEPAADLFMISITKMNAQKYLRFALTTAYNCWAKLKEAKHSLTFLQHLSNGEAFPKYIGILCAVFSEDCDKIINGSRSFKKRCFPRTMRKTMKEELERSYNLIRQAIISYRSANASISRETTPDDAAILLTIFNPIHRVYTYMSKVHGRFWKRYPVTTTKDQPEIGSVIEEDVDPKIRKKLQKLAHSVIIRC